MSILSRFLPKKKPVEIKNNMPKEKANIKKTFGVHSCLYVITKPNIVNIEFQSHCLFDRQAREFLTIMNTGSRKMYLKHPVMAVKHKLASMGVDYARYEQQKKLDDKIKAKEKASKERAKGRKEKK